MKLTIATPHFILQSTGKCYCSHQPPAPKSSYLRIRVAKYCYFNSSRMTRNTFFQGKTSIFENLTMRKGHFATMDISHLEQDLNGVKHWTAIGLSTYSEIAIAPFKAPNGQIQFPLLEPYRPILRVPVVFNPPWVMAAERIETYDKELKCTEREHICYNKTASSNKTLCCFGFSIELLKILQRELQFVPEIYFVADGFYGIFDEKTGNWNGIVRELVLGIGDLALGLSLSGKRAEYIEFSWSYLPLALNVIVEKRDIGPGEMKKTSFCFPCLLTLE